MWARVMFLTQFVRQLLALRAQRSEQRACTDEASKPAPRATILMIKTKKQTKPEAAPRFVGRSVVNSLARFVLRSAEMWKKLSVHDSVLQEFACSHTGGGKKREMTVNYTHMVNPYADVLRSVNIRTERFSPWEFIRRQNFYRHERDDADQAEIFIYLAFCVLSCRSLLML